MSSWLAIPTPLGLGSRRKRTLAAQLRALLNDAAQPSAVVNAGVPGFGPGQVLLRLRTFRRQVPSGALIVFLINPVNDLVNLASAVDYHYPKPHPLIEDGQLVFRPAPHGWGEGAFLFSRPFHRLNQLFQLRDQQRWYHSRLVKLINRPRDEPPVVGGVTQLRDATSPSQYALDDHERIHRDPLVYASRYWPEMPRLEAERERLAALFSAVMAEMQQEADANDWELVVVVALEALDHQAYGRDFKRKVEAAAPSFQIASGWSRQTVLSVLEQQEITHVVPDLDGVGDAESLFIPFDEHASALGIVELPSKCCDFRGLATTASRAVPRARVQKSV